MFYSRLKWGVACLLISCFAVSQTSYAIDLPVGSAVDVTLVDSVSSQYARKGSTVFGKTISDVKSKDNQVVIAKGSDVQITISDVKHKRGHDTAGFLQLDGATTTASDGTLVHLGLQYQDGKVKQRPTFGTVLLSILGVGLVLVPFGLFVKGDDAYIPSGTKIRASIQG
ncbi:MAG: hypothetical protein H2174_07635 [Vampirovibrio sp.]|nr:hypothetical protein [Vampirovibrio sp.]